MVQRTPFRAVGRFGYACKGWIAREIEEHDLGGIHESLAWSRNGGTLSILLGPRSR